MRIRITVQVITNCRDNYSEHIVLACLQPERASLIAVRTRVSKIVLAGSQPVCAVCILLSLRWLRLSRFLKDTTTAALRMCSASSTTSHGQYLPDHRVRITCQQQIEVVRLPVESVSSSAQLPK